MGWVGSGVLAGHKATRAHCMVGACMYFKWQSQLHTTPSAYTCTDRGSQLATPVHKYPVGTCWIREYTALSTMDEGSTVPSASCPVCPNAPAGMLVGQRVGLEGQAATTHPPQHVWLATMCG